LRSSLNEVCEEKLIELNPLAGWTYSRKESPLKNDDVVPLAPEEQAAILAMLQGQAHKNLR
ncbi:hypothetical protein SB717_33585, partial [Priestia sp. SIMBA_032]|uniref:hypothetical protein n=1 Tax=Priestia sp. SIMBA_032 TaxID=3085775 RepID=UPI00397E2ECB